MSEHKLLMRKPKEILAMDVEYYRKAHADQSRTLEERGRYIHALKCEKTQLEDKVRNLTSALHDMARAIGKLGG